MSLLPTKTGRRIAPIAASAALLLNLAAGAQAGVVVPHHSVPNHRHHHGRNQPDFSEQVVYSFQGGADGANPWGDLTQVAGSLYSTTLSGGSGGMGTVFKLSPTHSGFSEGVIHAFTGGPDGANPWQGLNADLFGSLYGTTGGGGSGGGGTVYKISLRGESAINVFKGTDGSYPTGSPNVDLLGNVYATTENSGSSGYGTVVQLTPSFSGGYTEHVLYNFQSGGDGQTPHGGLLEDLLGSLYGTTVGGGSSGAGTVFKLAPSLHGYKESILHSFTGADGSLPNANLVQDARGVLYGTATWGGSGTCPNNNTPFAGCGTIFKLTPQWNGTYTFSLLYAFQGGPNDGGGPNGGLLLDARGNIYGTTYYGGANDLGTVFMLTPQHNGTYTESDVWDFAGSGDGAHPAASLIAYGNAFYGTTVSGGANGLGTVFQVAP